MLRYWRVTDNKADMMYKTSISSGLDFRDKIDQPGQSLSSIISRTALNWHKSATGNHFLRFAHPLIQSFSAIGGSKDRTFPKSSSLRGLAIHLHMSTLPLASEAVHQNSSHSEVLRLPEGSWGVNNNHDVWINEGRQMDMGSQYIMMKTE
jgi:hypothetical protein